MAFFTNKKWKCTSTADIEGWSKPGFKDKKDPDQDFKAASEDAGILHSSGQHPFRTKKKNNGEPKWVKNIDARAKWIWAADAGEDDTVFCKIRI